MRLTEWSGCLHVNNHRSCLFGGAAVDNKVPDLQLPVWVRSEQFLKKLERARDVKIP